MLAGMGPQPPVSQSGPPVAPAAALVRWRALEREALPDDPVLRVRAWLERLAARMLCSGGRVGRLSIATGLCTIEDIAACVRAQLDAEKVETGALQFDIDDDLRVLGDLAATEVLAELCARLAANAWPEDVEWLHAELASRLLAAGREGEVLAALAPIGWHDTLLRWLARHGGSMSAPLRERLVARTAETIATTHLPSEYQVGLYAELAVLTGDERWLVRARQVLAALPADRLETTPDLPHPVESLAWGLASLGDFDAALATIAGLAPADRWSAQVRLLPLAPDPGRRAEIVEALIAAGEPLELRWAWIVEAAPETGARALEALLAIVDEDRRVDELGAAARFMRDEPARSACAWLLERARTLAPGSANWVRVWESLPDALTAAGCEDLLDVGTRRRWIDELLARPELDLWSEASAFVPDDRVVAVLERSRDGLAQANNYFDRELWCSVGLALLPRAPQAQASAWLELAAEVAPGMAIDGASIARLAVWTPEQQRSIVAARLAQHQREFLPGQLLQPWLVTLAWALPARLWPEWRGSIEPGALARVQAHALEFAVVPGEDAEERDDLLRMFTELTATSAWPNCEQVGWVFALLGRCAGEAAITAGLAALVDLRVQR